MEQLERKFGLTELTPVAAEAESAGTESQSAA
jgi:hypothetical protein